MNRIRSLSSRARVPTLSLVLLAVFFCAQSANAATIPFFSRYPQLNYNLWYVSNGWSDGDFESCEYISNAITVDQQNIKITLSNKGATVRPYSCGELHYNTRTGYGTYETSMKTAAGSGLNSNFFTYIGPPVGVPQHDEIDFEFLGKNPKTVQVNYWVNGVSSDGTIINLGFDASMGFHTYSFTWTPTSIIWYVDGKQVHQTKPGAKMPTNPSRIYISLWSGSAIENSWLGPFTYKAPVSAEYAWVKYTPLPN